MLARRLGSALADADGGEGPPAGAHALPPAARHRRRQAVVSPRAAAGALVAAATDGQRARAPGARLEAYDGHRAVRRSEASTLAEGDVLLTGSDGLPAARLGRRGCASSRRCTGARGAEIVRGRRTAPRCGSAVAPGSRHVGARRRSSACGERLLATIDHGAPADGRRSQLGRQRLLATGGVDRIVRALATSRTASTAASLEGSRRARSRRSRSVRDGELARDGEHRR